ncbi:MULTISPECIES: DUF4041 domain-containing protein [Streptomyces]|uniref:DUF4041 domain-containing protein n=1 Tax=Streptomyces TaxID=1883 RepID=UPI000BCFE664|nr:DUF4041 domain-containing protein [Streptomyces sp. P9-2B-1]MDF9867955.1 seryl-tRNA synthetase [Streptomyces pratensis]RAS22526.1 T5orf172 domain-containing protein [Streptomyces avidinii]WJY35419.1 DUF4041 domain-containing protein [Streptomyces sp. P9-2B-1]SNX79233.1 T5orf172 domain-containing protein [Streptomyces microflavus]
MSVSGFRFNPPPNWLLPQGWVPSEGWQPDPSWPPPPPGWQLWLAESPEAAPVTGAIPQQHTPQPAPPADRKRGWFGRRRRDETSELEELRTWIAQAHGADAAQVAGLVQRTRQEAAALLAQAQEQAEAIGEEARRAVKDIKNEAKQIAKAAEATRKETERQRTDIYQAESRLAELRAQIVTTDETVLLQQAGIYAYHHQLHDAVAYRSRLDSLKAEIKDLARNNQAVLAATDWTVNGSAREGRKMIRDFSKLMLRAYNAEADYAVRTMRPHRLTSLVDRLYKSRETIAKLGATMHIRISDAYHDARVRELQLTADFLQKKDEEKEAQRETRAREREEAAAQRELDREREKLNKELNHYEAALERLRSQGNHEAVRDMEAKLAEIQQALQDVDSRAANVRTGYVYVVSNIGAFGDSIVKIGMTRRLEPLDRVYELSGAAVPFRFDVHALIFSKDAVGLETRLHQEFADRRVNRVNSRKEFFYVTPTEVRTALERFAGEHLVEFSETPQALEWRASKTG